MKIRENTENQNPIKPALLILTLIGGIAVIAAHPALAAGLAEPNVTSAPAAMDAAFDEGNWTGVAAYAEQITQNDENASAGVWCRWGYSLRKTGQYQDALAAVSVGVEKEPDNAVSHLNRGYTYIALGEYRNARLDAEEALRLEPYVAGAYNIIALALLGEGDPKNALIAADTALALRPDHINYLNTRGMILIEQGEYSDAVTTLTQATESEKEYVAPYPDAVSPEENLEIARRLYEENKASGGLIIIAFALIAAMGAGAIYLHRRK